MPSDFEAADHFSDALQKLAALRRFSGPPTLFWQSYTDALVAVTNARFGLVARRREGDAPGWRKVVASPANVDGDSLKSFLAAVENLCDSAMENNAASKSVIAAGGSPREVGIAVRLDTGRPTER